jgi:two-component system invasion response regulator UvrY
MSYRKPPVKIGIVDDHNLFRKGLIKLIELADKENYLIVLEAESGKDMIKKLDSKALPDILILDIDMADMDGFETMLWLKHNQPKISVLVVSMVETDEAISRMMRLGVKGYLSKDIEVEDIHHALQAISNKGFYYTDFLTGKLIESLQSTEVGSAEIAASGESDLSTQINENEYKFIRLACTDLTYEQIANKMYLSPKTIDGYRAAIFNRFSIRNRPGLILFALKNNIFRIEDIK